VENDAGVEMSVEHSQRTISVTGVGRVKASADILVLSLAVETQDVTASGALTKNNGQVSAVLSALRDHGIKERDIQTTQLSIDPVMERQDQNNTRPPMIVAYRVRNGLSATLREISRAGVIIDAAVQAGGGAIRIDGVSFSFAEPANLLSEARKRAIDDAKNRTRQLADGLGVGLGDVISISESDRSGGSTTIRQLAAFTEPTPVLPGETEVFIQVTVDYAISPTTARTAPRMIKEGSND
jgi:uncharacterized protein